VLTGSPDVDGIFYSTENVFLIIQPLSTYFITSISLIRQPISLWFQTPFHAKYKTMRREM
jgi:hypothetical protein